MIKALLQGKPLGHPLHPLLVHFPIGLFALSLLLDGWSYVVASHATVRAAFYTMLFGEVAALLAAVPGLVDWLDIRRDHPARRVGLWHMALNVVAVVLYAANLVLRWDPPPGLTQTPIVPLVLSLLAVAILSYSGYLGGVMVYDDGIGVGRHRRRSRTPAATTRLPPPDTADGYVAVPGAAELKDGETLRVAVGETVLVVAKIDGGHYAFQEFCTHRFGPLSEGAFDGPKVMCPWHNSCFDVRTGKVLAGPAKVDLKVFDVSVADGQVRVRVGQS